MFENSEFRSFLDNFNHLTSFKINLHSSHDGPLKRGGPGKLPRMLCMKWTINEIRSNKKCLTSNVTDVFIQTLLSREMFVYLTWDWAYHVEKPTSRNMAIKKRKQKKSFRMRLYTLTDVFFFFTILTCLCFHLVTYAKIDCSFCLKAY